MEFQTKGTDYSLGEFYKAYEKRLPTVVMVTQGYCSEILAETLDLGLVIRIHSICRQPRVIAARLNDHGREESTYSFPLNYPVKFCFDDGLYQNEGQTLDEILEQRQLPVNVQFARKQFIKVGDSMASTSHFSTLRLTNVFDEISLLGNVVTEYELDQQVVQIPLYLSVVRFSEVIDVKDNMTDWEALKKKLDNAAKQMNFDAFSGNPEIAKYKSNDLSKLVSKGQVAHDIMYENFEPQTYTNVAELMTNVHSSGQETACNNDILYEPVEISAAVKRKDATNARKEVSKDQKLPKKPHATLFGELKERLKKDNTISEKTDESSKPIIISSKPGNLRKSRHDEPTLSSDTFGDPPPPIPPRLSSHPRSEVVNMTAKPQSGEDSYENLKFRAQVHPMPNLKSSFTSWNEEIPLRDGQTDILSSNLQQQKDIDDIGTVNVKVLKVEDLGRWMAEKLNLGKYVARFAEELVDGTMLADLDETLLREEFGFSVIEAKRLMKFAKEGHVPK